MLCILCSFVTLVNLKIPLQCILVFNLLLYFPIVPKLWRVDVVVVKLLFMLLQFRLLEAAAVPSSFQICFLAPRFSSFLMLIF